MVGKRKREVPDEEVEDGPTSQAQLGRLHTWMKDTLDILKRLALSPVHGPSI